MLSADRRLGMLYVKVPDIGSTGVATIRDSVDAWAAAHLDSTLLRIRHTGQRYIFDINQGSLARSQLWSILLSIGIVALFFAAAFRSWRMVLASLIPNCLPLLFTFGLIGWLGLPLDPKLGMVFSIAYGIAVDDTIHFLARFRMARKGGDNVAKAGVKAEIVPGIMPVTNFGAIQRMSAMTGTAVPAWLGRLFDGLDDHPAARQLVSATIAAEMCRKLYAGGVKQFHFYTLNRAELSYAICHLLGLRPQGDIRP